MMRASGKAKFGCRVPRPRERADIRLPAAIRGAHRRGADVMAIERRPVRAGRCALPSAPCSARLRCLYHASVLYRWRYSGRGARAAADRADRPPHRRPDRRARHLCRPLRVLRRRRRRRGLLRSSTPSRRTRTGRARAARLRLAAAPARHRHERSALQRAEPRRRVDPARQPQTAVAWEPDVVGAPRRSPGSRRRR